MALSHSPQLAELLNHVKARWAADLRVAIPGRVEKYDAATQLVDVQPLVKDRLELATSEETLQLPVITNVPLMFPGTKTWHMTFPVEAGDEVLLVFSDKSIDAWQDQGGISDPADARRHHLTDAVAIPGLKNNKNAISGVATGVIEIGKAGSDSQFVALSNKTKDEIVKVHDALNAGFSALRSDLSSIASHTHLVATTGSALAQSGTAAPSIALASLSSPTDCTAISDVASATVKVKG